MVRVPCFVVAQEGAFRVVELHSNTNEAQQVAEKGAIQRPLLIGIVAGEASGDILGASLMAGLKQLQPQVRFIGVGGPQMQAEGLQSLFTMETLSVMGFVDVLKQLPSLLRARKQVVTSMLAEQPDAFIGIDAPDFNLPIEKKLKNAGIRTLHYVSPSVWAWRPKRIYGIAKATHMVLGILPFEADFYAKYQVPYTFVGHPLADKFPRESCKQAARANLQVDATKQYVGILPGSRSSEVGHLAGPFIDAAMALQKQHPDLQFLVPLVNEARKAQFMAALVERNVELNLHLFTGQSHEVIAASDVTILASGTVALEAMLIKRPMVVCYRFGWLNFQLIKHFVKVRFFSLPNLLHTAASGVQQGEQPYQQPLVNELLQNEVSGANIAATVEQLFTNDNTQLYQRYQELHAQLQQDAGLISAQTVLNTIC